jgi:hypothetical protein
MKNQNFIILNDFRSFPITAALCIANMQEKKNISFIYSKKFITSNEYGQNLPKWYKNAIIFFIKIFYKVVVAPELSDEHITPSMIVGIDSSLQSITCDSGASMNKYPNLYENLKHQAIGSNEVSEYILGQKKKTTCVYVFNGRTASSSSITYALHHSKICLYYYEFASKHNGFLLFPFPCHNSLRIGNELFKLWKNSIISNPILYENGINFENEKLNNHYIKYYSEETLVNYDIVVFLSSDHEFSNLQEEIVNVEYIKNNELLDYVISKYGIDKKVAVRAHPNQSSDPNCNFILSPIIEKCKKFGFCFFHPTSGISSYDLIKNSSLVVVGLSSIAYDAVFLGSKVDIVGNISLKSIIESFPEVIKEDSSEIKHFSREILSLGKDLCFNKYPNKFIDIFARFFSLIERKYLNKI